MVSRRGIYSYAGSEGVVNGAGAAAVVCCGVIVVGFRGGRALLPDFSPLLSAHAFANADIGFTWCTSRQADDDNTHAILQRLADASQSLMPVGDITVAEYNELRHGQETMSKEVAFICASGPAPLSLHSPGPANHAPGSHGL